MPAQDEYTEAKPPSLWREDGRPKPKCSVRSCHNPALENGRCRRHLGNPSASRLREQVRRNGVNLLRKSR